MLVAVDLAGGEEGAGADALGEGERQDAVFDLGCEEVLVAVAAEVVAAHQALSAHLAQHVERGLARRELAVELGGEDRVLLDRPVDAVVDDVAREVEPTALAGPVAEEGPLAVKALARVHRVVDVVVEHAQANAEVARPVGAHCRLGEVRRGVDVVDAVERLVIEFEADVE